MNEKPLNIVSLNGNRCLGLSIYKETKYNTVQAVDDLISALDVLKKALPGYEFTIIQNQGNFIKSSITEVQETAILGIILAVVILFVFLRRIGVTAIISAAIPISVIATFNLMYFNGLTLNIMTLGGLALGAGMLVDNAIVVMENIFRMLENGHDIKDSAINGTAQVGGAITASTITTIIVFLPIVYLHGASGELFKDQAWTVAFSLFSSLFVAILVIPMLSVRFLKNIKTRENKNSIQFKSYPPLLKKILAKRWLVIISASILVLVSLAIVPFVGSEFMPKTDTGEITLDITLSEGTDLIRTNKTVNSLELLMKESFGDDLTHIFSHVGPGVNIGSGEDTFFENENTASIQLLFSDERSRSIDEIKISLDKLLRDIPELEYKFSQGQSPLKQILGTEDAPIVVEIKGEDLDVLENLSGSVSEIMSGMEELINVESSFEKGTPEVEIKIDRLRAGMYNIGVDQIATQLQDRLTGKNAGDWDYEGEMHNVMLMMPEISLSELEDIIIRSGSQEFRLKELAEISLSQSPREIYRNNQNRISRVTAQIAQDVPLDKIVSNMNNRFESVEIPNNYSINITGEELKREESMGSLTFALLLSILLVYMALSSQFESLIHPFTILLTIPLSAVGAILIFFILGIPFNIMAFIGIIMLAGIAVNDSIILVDAINQLKKEGLPREEAIIKAGERRIRPIIMTSLTTMLALFPLTLGFGEGAELRSPMALAVIGGLFTSTLLTLLVIPCVYYVLDVFRDKFKLNV